MNFRGPGANPMITELLFELSSLRGVFYRNMTGVGEYARKCGGPGALMVSNADWFAEYNMAQITYLMALIMERRVQHGSCRVQHGSLPSTTWLLSWNAWSAAQGKLSFMNLRYRV